MGLLYAREHADFSESSRPLCNWKRCCLSDRSKDCPTPAAENLKGICCTEEAHHGATAP